jgi:hypothetical protein
MTDIGIDPGTRAGTQNDRKSPIGGYFVGISTFEFFCADGKNRSGYEVGFVSRKSDDGMKSLSAGPDDCRIFDPHHRLSEPRESVGFSFQAPAKGGELNRLGL